jgi:hypothetical protein
MYEDMCYCSFRMFAHNQRNYLVYSYVCMSVTMYRVIHKSLWDFRPLRYSSRDGHAEEEHINRGRDTPSFCPTLQVLDMCTLGDAADINPVIKFLRHALHIYVVHLLDRTITNGTRCSVPAPKY